MSETAPPNAAENAPEEAPRRVLFEPFDPLIGIGDPARFAAAFAQRTQDVSIGLATVLKVLEADSISADANDAAGQQMPSLVGRVEAGDLMRFCIATLEMLAEGAEDRLDRYQAGAR